MNDRTTMKLWRFVAWPWLPIAFVATAAGAASIVDEWSTVKVPPPPAAKDEPVMSSGLDKFVGTELESILKQKGIKTVIIVGTAAHGAVLYTATAAATRGFQVIVPLDGISADIPYAEQYTAWHLANAPRIDTFMTLTTLDDVKF
jgi:nicotinamidase-related amidase